MIKKRQKSIKNELIKKAREAVIASVQTYNNPSITFKAETFIVLSIIGWTYLLHAYYRENKIDYRYYKHTGKRKKYDKTKHNAYKYWELERCLNESACPLSQDAKNNLKFLIGIRHEIEHQMTNKIDEHISAKLQACALNFNKYIKLLFGEKYALDRELALSIQFAPLVPEQKKELQGNDDLNPNIRNFIATFEDTLSDDDLKNIEYSYKVAFVPISVNRKGQADEVIKFIPSDSPLAKNANTQLQLLKEVEKAKYRPKEIVEKMQNVGYVNFKMYQHTELWKSKNARDSKYAYGVHVAGTWYWYEKWVNIVEEHCEKEYGKK